MELKRSRTRGHFGTCRVEDCTDLVWVKKHGLCQKHYNRLIEKGKLTLEEKTINCLRCGVEMNLNGAATVIQIYCSKKCSSAAKRQRIKELETSESKARDIRYKYEWRLKKKYGMTPEYYQTILIKQNYKCAICNQRQEDTKDGYLVVDHNHNNGKHRGLLCRPCNAALGGLGDSIELLKSSITYLEMYESESKDHFLQVKLSE